jgi:hypothetical protein
MKRKKQRKWKGVILSSLFFISCFSLNAADLHVGSGQTYSTVQDAVNAASSGDVIIIHAGTYREVVRIAKDGITIQPNGTDSVVMNGTEPLLSWTDEGNGVYSTTMNWDISEGEQTNQIFVDGKMIHLARWPNETSDDIVMNPTMAEMNGVEEIDYNTGEITDFEFANENSARWEGASIFINLSNPECKKDGQGWTGPIKDIVDGKIRTQAGGKNRYKSCGNWHIAHGSRYYLFNPTPSAVAATGGVDSLLSNGEWWKNGTTLYVRMPDGGEPASSLVDNNLVEAKKYPYAFRPDTNDVFSNVTIKDLTLFATSITTDNDFFDQFDLSNASGNVLDNLNIKYVTHSYDCSGQMQTQWNGQSGIILSGSNNVLKNSTIVYSSASAVSLMGKGNLLLNCFIHDVNYNVTEAGAVNCGKKGDVISVDHIIAYNTIYNTPHSGISMRSLNEMESEVTPGKARIHHNVLYNCLARAYDCGVIDGSRSKNGLRIDHNIIYDSPERLHIGIYLDYGDIIDDENNPGEKLDYYHPADLIVDHNVIYNVWSPIQPNACSFIKVFNNTIKSSSNHYIGGVHLEDSAVYIQNNIGIPDDFGEYAIINHNLSTSTALNNNYFTDAANGDFTLTSNAVEAIDSGANVAPYNGLVKDAPDIGAYEYGKTKWTAGATTTPITTYELNLSANNGGKVSPGNGPIRDGEVFAIEAEDVLGAEFNQWSGDVTGSENPKEVTMNSDVTALGEFSVISIFDLNIEATNGSVRLFPGGGTYNINTEVELTATPASEAYYFSDWTGGITDSANPVTVTMDDNYTITANFTAKPTYSLTIEEATNGSVIVTPDQANYLAGTVVNIVAIPDSAYKFVNWTGDASVSDSTIRQNITMDHDITLTAHFVSTAGMNDLNAMLSGVNIYPNPGDGSEVNILLNGNSEDVDVSIYNVTGAKLYSGTFYSNAFTIPLSGKKAINSGYYLIEISIRGQKVRRKLIIE